MEQLLVRDARSSLPEPLLVALTSTLVDRGEHVAALRALERAGSNDALLLRADLLVRAGDAAAAVALVERVLLRDLDWPGARERHSRGLAALGLHRAPTKPDPSSATMMTTAPDAPFALLREIARGGAGVVYEAEDRELGRRVALKMYHRPDRDRPQLLHEARVAVALRGPGLVRVFDVDPQRGWLALEWAPLGALRSRIDRAHRAMGLASGLRPGACPRGRMGPPRREARERTLPRPGGAAAQRLRHGAETGRAQPTGEPRLRLARATRGPRERSAGRHLWLRPHSRAGARCRRPGRRDVALACARDRMHGSGRRAARGRTGPGRIVGGRLCSLRQTCRPPTPISWPTCASARSRSRSKSSSAASTRARSSRSSTCARRTSGAAGFIPGAISIPRGFLEIQVEQKLPDKNAHIVAYCAGGTRSALAAATLQELGYTNVETANPGFVRWKDLELPDGHAAAAHRRAARALLAAHPPARGRRGGAGQAPQEQGAAARRGRPRLAGRDVPRGRGRRHARHRRRRRRSTRRTCSGRSSTPPAAWACRRSRARRRPSPS